MIVQSRTYADSKMAWWKVLVLTAAFFAGNTNALRKRILNGQDGNIQNIPYQVSLRFLGKHYCGGSIITEKHILTAAHCILDQMSAPYIGYSVVTGTSYRLYGGSDHEIANVTVHPGVECDDNRCTQDIAIITLEDTIHFNKKQQKVKLAGKNYEVGSKATLSGWGLVEQIPSNNLAYKLQMLETELISMEECQKKVINPEKTKILDTEICAFHSTGTGACAGDSGGPLVADGELIGVVAWVDGPQCAIGRPDVFTNVYKYLDFIKSVTNQSV